MSNMMSWEVARSSGSVCVCVPVVHAGVLVDICLSNSQLYAPQTKILEGRTNLSECVFETIFNDS
jgi:hypothetical protein